MTETSSNDAKDSIQTILDALPADDLVTAKRYLEYLHTRDRAVVEERAGANISD